MTYCVQCGTKVKAANRYCNACSAAIAIPDQHSHLLFPASLITPQTHIRPDKSETLPSESRHAYIFIYIVIIVTYFLLTLGLWIHRNHQARISVPITAISEKTQKPQSTLSTKALAAPIEKKAAFSTDSASVKRTKKSTKKSAKSRSPKLTYPLASNEYFQSPFMMGLLKKNDSSHADEFVQGDIENDPASNASKPEESSDNLLQKLLTSITQHGGPLPCSDVEKLMSQCN